MLAPLRGTFAAGTSARRKPCFAACDVTYRGKQLIGRNSFVEHCVRARDGSRWKKPRPRERRVHDDPGWRGQRLELGAEPQPVTVWQLVVGKDYLGLHLANCVERLGRGGRRGAAAEASL